MSDEKSYTVIATAISVEYNTFSKALNLKSIRSGGYDMAVYTSGAENRLLVKTGSGLQAARQALTYLCNNYKICGLLNIGIAGAVSPGLQIGDILLADEIGVEGKDAYLPKQLNGVELGNKLMDNAIDFKAGRLLSVEKAVLNRNRRDEIYCRYRALAVDMEAFAISEVCNAVAMPFACIKIISDNCDFSFINLMALIKNFSLIKQTLVRIANAI